MVDTNANLELEAQPSMRVIRAVADHKDVSTMDLEPLYETIDADALDHLLSRPAEDCEVLFRYEECRITVTPGGVDVQSVREPFEDRTERHGRS